MNVYIPSRSRASVIAQRDRTLEQLSRNLELRHRIYIVVPSDQYEEYVVNVADRAHVLVRPAGKISVVRQWIGEHAKVAGERFFCMMDDDLCFSIRKGVDDWHLRPQTVGETALMLDRMEELLLRGYGAVGVSARGGNNYCTEDPMINTRMTRILAFPTDQFLRCQHNRVEVMEDFDILLQLLRRGMPNAVLTKFAQDQKQTQELGGCSDWRTHEIHEASARLLAKLHAPFVRLRDKKNKSGGEFGSRKEVTIYWKKAFRFGSHNTK